MRLANEKTPVTLTLSVGQPEAIAARTYQTELMEQAKRENLIICLPTGSGKTYIAVMLIKEMSYAIRGSLTKGAKRTIFLVKTVQLAAQQSDYIRIHTDLIVGTYYGDLGVDLWRREKWDIEFENHQVLVFTAQVFLNLIDHDFFSLKNINLIIFDECHHASGDNHYAALMNKHYDSCPCPPRILGLTASITSKKIKSKNLLESAKELEKIYRAQIAHRDESFQHGTSVQVQTISCESYLSAIIKLNESLTIPFEFLRSMKNTIESHLSQMKDKYSKIERDLIKIMLNTDYLGDNISMYQNQSGDYTACAQSQPVLLIKLKSYLENLVEVGLELGLQGLFVFAKELRKKLKDSTLMLQNIDQQTMAIFNDISQRLDCLVDDILKNLCRRHETNCDVLFSPKIMDLLDRIINQQQAEDTSGRCIVFVERVYTATVLSQVLSDLVSTLEPPWNSRLKIRHVTGIKAMYNNQTMTASYQQRTIKDFRKGIVNVLIATAVIEEGLDIPTCDLVVRFNKPHNFSSYMQSKGRARAKHNAFYVLFMDKSNTDSYERDRMEYENYEEIEKKIREGFSSDERGDLGDDFSQIPPYCPSEGIVIDATRAAQLIMEYCVLLGNGQIFPPRFLFYGAAGSYTCILSMPANCPVRDDIKSTNKNKKLAKYGCCLEMVKELHKRGEFNEKCLPNRNRTSLTIAVPIENKIFKLVDRLFEDKSDSSVEIFPKLTATFPVKSEQLSNQWCLYRIHQDLGFVAPSPSINLPEFHLYQRSHTISIKVTYLKSIDYPQHQKQLEEFCRYLFEYVFEAMHTESLLKFDLPQTPLKLLPCFLTNVGEIDWRRMQNMCNRKDKLVRADSEMNEHELYCPSCFDNRQYFVYIPDSTLHKRGSDRWDKEAKLNDVKTYADHFASRIPSIRIRPDTLLVTLKGVKRPKINYLNETLAIKREEPSDPLDRLTHYPVEVLLYAPVNQLDLEVIWKLPSLLVRISQLYHIERLRKRFATGIQSCSLADVDRMPPVTFRDYLKISPTTSFLPLVPLTYNNLLSKRATLQPSPAILFQAITRRSSHDNMDMESLEILGDCFLKVTVSMSLYHRYPSAGAGALTVEKAKQISNENLYRIAVLKKLNSYLNVMKVDFRGDDANWLPPGYVVREVESNSSDDGLGLKRYQYQKVKRKAFADMIEAFMGAFLLSTDYATTIQFMKWLGIDVIPTDENDRIMKTPPIHLQADGIDRVIQRFYDDQGFSFVEKTINYHFRNKAYLIAAFTHPSNFANRLTNCYERLEFLGDAVLDFLVTRHIFVTKKDIKPGHVTDIRQDLSNNGRLAYILVASRLHTKIMHNSPDLFGKISVYVGDEELFPKDSTMESALGKDTDQWADSTAPKALADVFEALVGAIFLDSDKCLATVWQVIEPLLGKYIERSVHNPNLNPVRSFFEQGGKVVDEFTLTDPKQNSSTSVCYIETPNGDQFTGRNVNKKMAKFEACRQAIRHSLNHVA